jgi:hypothetical protein
MQVGTKVTKLARVEDNGIFPPGHHAWHAQSFHLAPFGLALAATSPATQRESTTPASAPSLVWRKQLTSEHNRSTTTFARST